MIAEVKPLFLEPVGRNLDSPAGIKAIEDAAVFPKHGIDFANVLVRLAVAAVIVSAPALVRAEALVSAALKRRAALLAGPGVHGMKIRDRSGGYPLLVVTENLTIFWCSRLEP